MAAGFEKVPVPEVVHCREAKFDAVAVEIR